MSEDTQREYAENVSGDEAKSSGADQTPKTASARSIFGEMLLEKVLIGISIAVSNVIIGVIASLFVLPLVPYAKAILAALIVAATASPAMIALTTIVLVAALAFTIGVSLAMLTKEGRAALYALLAYPTRYGLNPKVWVYLVGLVSILAAAVVFSPIGILPFTLPVAGFTAGLSVIVCSLGAICAYTALYLIAERVVANTAITLGLLVDYLHNSFLAKSQSERHIMELHLKSSYGFLGNWLLGGYRSMVGKSHDDNTPVDADDYRWSPAFMQAAVDAAKDVHHASAKVVIT